MKENSSLSHRGNNGRRIWIDLENSPHIPFFKPIIGELEDRGYSVAITARDCFQVCGLADMMELNYLKVGHHYGKNKAMKVLGLLIRSLQLVPFALRERPCLALSHGSRTQVLAASLLNIPSCLISDYEYVQSFIYPTFKIVPELIPDEKAHGYKKMLRKYPGIKEDVYVPCFKPDPTLRADLGIAEDRLLATIRPPATEAHYHNPESEGLFEATVNLLGKSGKCSMVILPRNEKKQTEWIRSNWPEWCGDGTITIPEHVVDGLNLIWNSDLVISGGGTMNREAAALRVPVYSIFRGTIGAVDRYLSETGRLVLLTSVEDVEQKIRLLPRDRKDRAAQCNQETLHCIVDDIIEAAENHS
jgi:hypothetical protein